MAARAALPAKASVPRATNALPRARVFRILDRALSRGAAWIAAPAGAGKTTAVASYLAARRQPAVWYDVDTTDKDCANVFVYLSGALRAATLKTFERCQLALHAAGGVGPTDELRALHDEARSQIRQRKTG